MATVSTSTGTYLSNLFNPQVVADLIDTKLIDNLVFAPLARIDTTLEGRAVNTVTLPYYTYIGAASAVNEGEDIPITQLTESTKQVTILKIGKALQLTDEALLSGYGDPAGEAVNQATKAIADKVEKILFDEMNTKATKIYQPSGAITAADLPLALAEYGEDADGDKVLICSPAFYATLLGSNWIPASQIAAEVKVKGALGMAYGCQVIVSNRVKDDNFFIVKPGALAIFMKRDTLVEFDRDILSQSNVFAASKLFAPYLLNPNNLIKIVNGMDSALAKITLVAEAGTAAGNTKITVSGYTPGDGESYKYKVGDAANNVYLGETIGADWTSWNGSADITAASGKIVTIVSVKSGKALAAGTVASVPHA